MTSLNKFTPVVAFAIGLVSCAAVLSSSLSEAFFMASERTFFVQYESIIAHRGFHKTAAENSLEAIQQALDLGADMIEFDVHQSSDGKLYLLHDFSLDRTTSMSGLIKNKSSEEIKNQLPRLEDALELVNGKSKLIIELKAGHSFYPGIEKNLTEAITQYEAEEWCAVHSFSDEVLVNLAATESGIELHKLFICYIPFIELMIDDAIHFKGLDEYSFVDGLSVSYVFANRELIEMAHDNNQRLHVWNINSGETAINLAILGVDGFITDEPDQFIQWKGEKAVQ